MSDQAFDVVKWVVEEERKRLIQNPPPPQPPPERPTIHWTELKEEVSGRADATDWNHYVKHVGRLLAEGQEGRWVLIVGGEIIGIYDTETEGDQVRAHRFLKQPVLLQQVLTREPIFRGPMYFRLCPS
jgi:hypothetical protein